MATNRHLLLLRHSILAAAAALIGLPVTSIFWNLTAGSGGSAVVNLTRMSGTEWAILLAAFVGPATLLGATAGFVLRRSQRRGLAAAAAVFVGFAACALGLSGFYWFLSSVL